MSFPKYPPPLLSAQSPIKRNYDVVGVSNKEYAFIMKMVKEKFTGLVMAGLDLLFPPTCPHCKEMTGHQNRFLCVECFSLLNFIKTPYCTCCGRSFSSGDDNHLCGDCLKSSWNFDKARSIFVYEEIIAGLIHGLKYSGNMTGLATFQHLSRHSPVLDDLTIPDFIVPVPLHIKRLRERGFNQALLLARKIFPGEKEKIKYDLLLRQMDTPTQTGLSGKERRRNLKNAFVVKKTSEIIGKNILIIDDVFTTGATVNACAKVLKTVGCKKVEVMTICRADKTLS